MFLKQRRETGIIIKKSDESGKRDSVPLSGRLSFLYACGHPQAEATYPKTRTSSPFGPCGPASSYLVLQPIRFTPPECHHPMRELLPRVFTLTSAKRRLFSVALAVILSDPFLLGSMVLCAVPTFLVPAFPTRDSPSHRGGKNKK